MTFPASTNAFAVACGVGGAFVDVSDWVLFNEGGISRQWGAPSGFDGVRPGEFAVTLDNSDGRFTPGNGAVLDTPLVEGRSVCWQLNGRLVEGTIRAFKLVFADVANGESARVRLTCDDLLGELSRTRLGLLADDVLSAAGLFFLYRFNDGVTASGPVDSGPYGLPALKPDFSTSARPTFGAAALPWVGETQANCGTVVSEDAIVRARDIGQVFEYDTDSAGAYGFWLTLNETSDDASQFFSLRVVLASGFEFEFESGPSVGGNNRRVFFSVQGGATINTAVDLGSPVYVSTSAAVSGADLVFSFYVDGVLVGTRSAAHGGATSNAELSPETILLGTASSSSTSDFNISRFSHTRTRAQEELIRDATTEAGGLSALAASVTGVSLASLPADLAQAEIALGDVDGDTALDVINSLISTEQGYLYTTTTGTLTNPTTTVVVRERTRPTTADHTFTTTTDILGAPIITRDLTNTVSTVTVTGGNTSQRVEDSTLTPLVGAASTTERVLLTKPVELRMWGQDRLQRGTNSGMDVREFTIDAQGADTDLWADLLAVKPGDRVQIAGLPETQLGFSTFDGWVVGGSEAHSSERNLFTFRLARTLPNTAVYDTDRYMADGELTLNASRNAAVTTFSIASTGALLSTTDVPYTIQFDDEQMTVTAVSGSSSPQSATVTRGVNGTTAASHSAGAVLVSVPDSLYAF